MFWFGPYTYHILYINKKYVDFKKRAARIILNAKYDIPSLQLFKKLGWLSIQNRLEYHKSILMYKCINNSAPDYLCNLFDMNTNSNIYSLTLTMLNCTHKILPVC